MKPSHTTTPRMLREATLTGIGFSAAPTASPLLALLAFAVGFLLGAML